jgi:hypothetical protein
MMRNWRGFCRKRLWPNYNIVSRNSLGLRKSMKTLNQDSRSPGPRFEPGILRIRSRSVNHSTTTFGESALGMELEKM